MTKDDKLKNRISALLSSGLLNRVEIARALNISRNTLYLYESELSPLLSYEQYDQIRCAAQVFGSFSVSEDDKKAAERYERSTKMEKGERIKW